MTKSRLKPMFAAELLKKENEDKLLRIAIHFDVAIASIRQAIRRQSEYLTQPAYAVQIQKALGLKPNVSISEIYSIDETFLSKHN